MLAVEVEDRIESLCIRTEQMKPYLLARWRGDRPNTSFSTPAGADEYITENVEVPS
jgi:hypothetical protein